MNIQSKIILTIVSVQLILIVSFGIIIFYFSKENIDKQFEIELEHRTQISEKVILEKNIISTDEYKEILKKHTLELVNEKRYYIEFPYNTDSLINIESNKFPEIFINELIENKYSFYSDDKKFQIFGKEYIVEGKKWLIIVSASNTEGFILLSKLKNIIIIGISIISMVLFIVSYFLARSILLPIKRKISSAMKISSSNLHQRIEVVNTNDEIGQLAIAFNRMLDRLEESFELQSSFISNASHEIKNPLTMISGTAEIALLKDRTNEEYKKTLESIIQDSDYLNSLVNELFLLAKTDANYEKLPKDYFPINDILETLNDQNNKLYPNKIRIIISNFAQNTLIYGNKNLLISALQNLVDNAIKFSKGEEVIIEVEKIEKKLNISIIDKGPGVDSDELKKITDAFYRSESVRNIKGHGIGLALTKKIVELHNGNLELKNKNISSGLIAKVILPFSV